MAIETTFNPGIIYRGHILLSTDASLVAKLTPGAAVQLGIEVFLHVRDDTLEIHVGDNLGNNNCKTDRDPIYSLV